jgi:tRNA U38,U39,U40 pseudouridine synthase TruA
MLSFESKRATITESETYTQGFLTHPLREIPGMLVRCGQRVTSLQRIALILTHTSHACTND